MITDEGDLIRRNRRFIRWRCAAWHKSSRWRAQFLLSFAPCTSLGRNSYNFFTISNRRLPQYGIKQQHPGETGRESRHWRSPEPRRTIVQSFGNGEHPGFNYRVGSATLLDLPLETPGPRSTTPRKMRDQPREMGDKPRQMRDEPTTHMAPTTHVHTGTRYAPAKLDTDGTAEELFTPFCRLFSCPTTPTLQRQPFHRAAAERAIEPDAAQTDKTTAPFPDRCHKAENTDYLLDFKVHFSSSHFPTAIFDTRVYY